MLSFILQVLLLIWVWSQGLGRAKRQQTLGVQRPRSIDLAMVAGGMTLVAVGQVLLVVLLLQSVIDAASVPPLLQTLSGHRAGYVTLVILLLPLALVVIVLMGLLVAHRLKPVRSRPVGNQLERAPPPPTSSEE